VSTARKEIEIAGRIRELLEQGNTRLDQRISLRLYEARCDALRHQMAPAATLGIAGMGHHVVDLVQHHRRGIVALLALAVGALSVHLWQNAQEVDALAEIDTELLSDEVPPSAYTDQGFLEWLQRVSESEEESLPE
jgi:uncharacterized protein YjiS (DUF1127 family)